VDLRFRHQMHEMPIPIAPGVIDLVKIRNIEAQFRTLYAEAYSVESNDPAQIVNIRVHAVGHVSQPELTPASPGDHNPARALKGTRKAYFTQARDFVETKVYDRALLKYQDSFAGPAIIEEPDSTTICPPGYSVEVDAYLDLVPRRS
jgi:N-methylhydantoinase A